MSEGIITEKKGSAEILLPERISSDNSSELLEQIRDEAKKAGQSELILDAAQTGFISSAGLRALMTLKNEGVCFEIINVVPQVYEIFDMTGFTLIFKIRRKMREISAEGLEVIGKGATSTVYRLDNDQILKVFNDALTLDDIQGEISRTKKAFLKGIVTAISYDVVRVGDSYGAVYEFLNAKTLSEVMRENPDRVDELASMHANLVRKMNRIILDKQTFGSAKENYLRRLDQLKDYCPPSTLSKMRAIIEAVPERETFIHGDVHTNNIMVENDHLVLIDMGATRCGHPIFDLMSVGLMRAYCDGVDDAFTLRFDGKDRELIKRAWNQFLKVYFNTDDKERLQMIHRICMCYSALRCWMVAAIVPIYPRYLVQYSIDEFEKYYGEGDINLDALGL